MSIDTAPGAEAFDWDRVVPGELIKVPAPETTDDDGDDIADGVIEVRPYQPPVIYRAGTAAMVAAAKTGRAVGLTARGGWTGLGYFGHGTKALAVLGYRYVRAHDLQETLGGMSKGADWNKVEIVRKKRWKTLGWLAGMTAALDLTGWWALVAQAEMTAADSWAILPGAELVAAVTGIALYGRYRITNPGMAPGQILADQDANDEEPFPLAWCNKPAEIEECVSRALDYEGIGTRRIALLGHPAWGYEIDIDLKGSTPGKVNAVADQLDAHFDIKKGGTLIEPDAQRSAHITLRLVTSDPFADMAKPAVHAPNSLDISEPVNLFRCMDGTRPEIVIEGNRVLVIGVSGSAKSTGVLRDLAEAITACHNAIGLDLDPIKDGLREFEGVMAAPPIRGNKDCEKWLGHLVKMAEARNAVRNRLGMGDTWIATKEYPAIFPFVDEFIYLSPKAKQLFIMLLRLGKQSGIYPLAAGQDATSDSLGDAIADSFTLRVMLASRHADIPLVLGSGAISQGFRPDRLQPAQNKDIRNDAGRSYIQGAGLTRPLLYGWNEYSRADIERAVEERKAAGRPWFDHDTLAAADLLHVIRRDGQTSSEATLADRLDALAKQGGVEDAEFVAVILRTLDERQADFLPTSEILLPALADAGFDDVDATALSNRLRKHAPGVAATREQWDGRPQVRGWSRAAVEQAAAGLIDPSTARLKAA